MLCLAAWAVPGSKPAIKFREETQISVNSNCRQTLLIPMAYGELLYGEGGLKNALKYGKKPWNVLEGKMCSCQRVLGFVLFFSVFAISGTPIVAPGKSVRVSLHSREAATGLRGANNGFGTVYSGAVLGPVSGTFNFQTPVWPGGTPLPDGWLAGWMDLGDERALVFFVGEPFWGAIIARVLRGSPRLSLFFSLLMFVGIIYGFLHGCHGVVGKGSPGGKEKQTSNTNTSTKTMSTSTGASETGVRKEQDTPSERRFHLVCSVRYCWRRCLIPLMELLTELPG